MERYEIEVKNLHLYDHTPRVELRTYDEFHTVISMLGVDATFYRDAPSAHPGKTIRNFFFFHEGIYYNFREEIPQEEKKTLSKPELEQPILAPIG